MRNKEIKKEQSENYPAISVILPFYGDKNDLSNCLKGIREQNFKKPFEVIVIESGNDPDVKQLVASFPNSVLISSPSLLYPGKARNLGVANAKSNLLAFIDADSAPVPDWLSAVYSVLKNNYELVTGPIINLYPFHPIASIDNLLQCVDFQKHRPSKNIRHLPGGNFGITKELFNEMGGFLEELKSGSDVKFSESAIKKCKNKVCFSKEMIIKHSGRKSYKKFINHNEEFGFYRGLLNLKNSARKSKFRNSMLYSIFFGIKRLIYISVRTVQWNPIGIIRIIFYFPFLILGLSAWTAGFRKGLLQLEQTTAGNQKLLKEYS